MKEETTKPDEDYKTLYKKLLTENRYLKTELETLKYKYKDQEELYENLVVVNKTTQKENTELRHTIALLQICLKNTARHITFQANKSYYDVYPTQINMLQDDKIAQYQQYQYQLQQIQLSQHIQQFYQQQQLHKEQQQLHKEQQLIRDNQNLFSCLDDRLTKSDKEDLISDLNSKTSKEYKDELKIKAANVSSIENKTRANERIKIDKKNIETDERCDELKCDIIIDNKIKNEKMTTDENKKEVEEN